jgi:hypothetical protein
MKLTSNIIADFVKDFDLEVYEFGVCFDAIVNFNLPDQNFNLQTEVHLESALSSKIDTICLLNPIVALYRMPIFFNEVNHQFLYLYRKGLIITGSMTGIGAYSVSIFPRSRYCNPKTLEELKARKFN